MTKADDPKRDSTRGVTPGLEDASAPGPVGPDGQHASYWVLSEEERACGFVRPVRTMYIHSGDGPRHPLRDLDDEERARFPDSGYVKFEAYPESESPVSGRYWTQERLDRAQGCGTVTTMSQAIAETYARDPKFYGATFCVGCRAHFPVAEFRWLEGGVVTDEVLGS